MAAGKQDSMIVMGGSMNIVTSGQGRPNAGRCGLVACSNKGTQFIGKNF